MNISMTCILGVLSSNLNGYTSCLIQILLILSRALHAFIGRKVTRLYSVYFFPNNFQLSFIVAAVTEQLTVP